MRRAVRNLIVAAIALASLGLTAAAWLAAREQSEREDRLRFELRAAQIAGAVRGRMLDYEQVLRGAAALFAAGQIEQREWTAYVRRLETQASYPGVQAIGYGRVRRDGTQLRVPVTFVEPLDERTARTVGLDMYADPARRAAMDSARASAAPALTGPVQLLQDAGAASRAGLVMYVPVFRGELEGFVYGEFRVGELIEGTIGTPPGVRLRLLDVNDARSPAVLFEQKVAFDAAVRYELAETLTLRNRSWRLEAAAPPGLSPEGPSDRPRLVLIVGLLISALLSGLTWSLLNTARHARELAQRIGVTDEELRESERRLALALESSGLAMFDWDLRSGLVHLGARWSEIVGGVPGPRVTPIQELERLVHADDLPGLRERLRQLLKGETPGYRVEHRVRKTSGEWIWIESVAEVSERDESGGALRVTGTNGDVTRRRALAELKNAFLANVSHELRTPLTAIVGSLELLREGSAGELPPDARQFVEMAHANSERLAELIGDLLDLERAESERLHLELERLDAAKLLEEAASLNASYAARFRAHIGVVAPDRLEVTADRRRLLQVLTNFISNAAKFSPRGGEIGLAARAQGDRVVFSVADQGPGVPDEFKARLFGKFEQAAHGKAGTGLGLAICKSLVERMGGRIWCESESGKGATFFAELPRAR